MTVPENGVHAPASVVLYAPAYVLPVLVSRSQIGPAACAAVICGSAVVPLTIPPTSDRSSSRLTRPCPSSEIALILT